MTAHTYSLEEVASQVLPPEWTDSVRWLARRLNRGDLSGYRVGRTWRMTDADVDLLIAKHSNAIAHTVTTTEPQTAAVTFIDGLSERSRNRIRRTA